MAFQEPPHRRDGEGRNRRGRRSKRASPTQDANGAPEGGCLWLLPSGPDQVHSPPLPGHVRRRRIHPFLIIVGPDLPGREGDPDPRGEAIGLSEEGAQRNRTARRGRTVRISSYGGEGGI